MVDHDGLSDHVPAAAGSLLDGLRADLAKAKEGLYIDLRVPRIEPPLFVRYGPLTKPVIDKANAKTLESKDEDRIVVGKALALALVCQGVFREDADGKPAGDPAQWPRFGPELARLLDLPEDCGAVTVVRALYLTDGDVMAAADEVTDWSVQAERRAQEQHEGN